ncbi:MAG: glycosyltransferase family 2 protein [Proteobacteria bacterium]|nr:glycosyltransferase family 2 protein [Pseudomonadota bacterium]
MTTISVIIPVYNEERSVLPVLRAVNAQSVDGFSFEVIVVDDGSVDGSGELLAAHPELYSKLIRLPRNRGKGAAVKAGLEAASGEFVLFQDADLEYDPADFRSLLTPIKRFDADVVVGSRFLAPQYTRVCYFWHKIGNALITLCFNVLNNTTFSDIYSCYLVYRNALVNPADLTSSGWAQHAEILSRAVRAGTCHYEVPISYHGRTYAEGKKIKAAHIFGIIGMIFRQRFLGW